MNSSRSLANRPSEVSELNANSERMKKNRPNRFLRDKRGQRESCGGLRKGTDVD